MVPQHDAAPGPCYQRHRAGNEVPSWNIRPAFGWISRKAPVAFAGRIWHSSAARRRVERGVLGCGCSSGVEHNLAKVGVEGSNPFARSRDWRPSETGDRRCDISSQNFLANVPSLHRCRRSDIARAMFCAFCTRSFAKRRSPQRKKPPPERGPYLVPSRLVNSQTAFSELLGSR